MENEDWLEDDESLDVAEEFTVGDLVVLYTRVPARKGRGEKLEVELGQLMGFVPEGVVFRRSHRKVYLVDENESAVLDHEGEQDWRFEPLQRSILTFINWRVIDRLESSVEVTQEVELGEFAALLDVAEPEDIMVQVTEEDDA